MENKVIMMKIMSKDRDKLHALKTQLKTMTGIKTISIIDLFHVLANMDSNVLLELYKMQRIKDIKNK